MRNLRRTAHSVTLTCLLLLVVTMTTVVSEGDDALVLDPPEKIAVEVGKSGEVTCELPEGVTLNVTDTIMWLNENGTNVNDLNRTQITEETGVLKLEGLTLSDSGDFVCTTKSRAYNSTVNVKVYIMPSYFTEAMVIIGINIALILLFIGCATHKLIQNKRDKAKARKTNRRV